MNIIVVRNLKLLGAVVAASGLLSAGASAAERPDDRAGMIGVGAAQTVATPDAFERAVLRSTATPDAFERAVLRESIAIRPDDRSGIRGPGVVPIATSSEATSVDDGVQLGDALLGAAAMLGVVLLGGVAAVGLRSRGKVALR